VAQRRRGELRANIEVTALVIIARRAKV